MKLRRRLWVVLSLLSILALGTVAVQAQTPSISVYPSDGSTDISPGTTISASFKDSMNPATVEAALTIDPPTEGTFVWSDENRYMQYRPSEPLAALATYQLAFGTSARTARGAQLLREPYRWQLKTAADQVQTSFGYRVPVQFVTPAGKRGVPIQPGYPRLTMDFTLYAVDMPAFAARYAKLKANETNVIDTTGLPQVAAWRAHLDSGDSAARATLPDGTTPGIYLLDAHSPRVKGGQTFVILSDYAVVAKSGSTGRLAWVTRVPDGTPAPDAAVTLLDAAGQVLQTVQADGDGLVRFDTSNVRFVTARTNAGQTTLVALDENWYASGYWYGWWGRGGWQPSPVPYVTHIHTDRPIYRPGHTVHYKATTRHLVGDDFVLVDVSTPVTVTIKDAAGNSVSTTKPVFDGFGSIAGDLALGEDAGLGDWHIEVNVAGQTATLYFAVQAYVKPDYEVTVTADRDFYVTGDTAEVAVKGRYYFGQPAAGADVVLRVYRGYYYYGGENTPTQEFKGVLTADGTWKGTVNLFTEAERTYAEYYWFEAEVTDASRRPVVSDTSVPVYPADFDLTLEAERYGVELGNPVAYTVRTTGHDGNPIAGRLVTVEVGQYRWEQNRGSWYETLARRQVTTGADGSVRVVFDDLKEGWYQVQATATDDAGHVVHGWSYAWLYSNMRPWYWYGGLELTTDKTSYAPGDTARVLIKSPLTKATTALVTVEREELYDEYVVPMQGAATVEIPIKADYAPNVWVKVQYWEAVEDTYNQAEGRMVTGMVNLSVPAEDRRLKVSISPDADTHGPAEAATFTVRVTDSGGQPVDAQLSFALVDKSVLALAQDRSGDIFDAFWSAREDTVGTYDSIEPSNWYGYPRYSEDAGAPGRGGGPQPQPPAAPTTTPAPNEKTADEASQSTPRREFPDTAYWDAAVVTGPDGVAEVTLTLPDSLTTWVAAARAVTRDTKVGQGKGELVVTKPIIADAAIPRFAVQGDQFALDVLGRNYVGGELQATTTLDTPGLVQLDPGDKALALPFNETKFSRWSVVASKNGTNPVTAWVRTAAGEDGVEVPLTVKPFAVPERFARAGSTESSVDEAFDVPFNAVPEASSVEVRLAPGMALGVLDGLEELIGYPYGCVEQTMSRMLPNAVIARLLRVLEIEAPEITSQLPEMMALGLQKLYGFQNSNGSWGWWHWQYSEGNVYTTAYVLHGLTLTKMGGFDVDPNVLERGFTWLAATAAQEKDPRIQAYAAYVLALGGRGDAGLAAGLYDRRGEMDAFALAALAVALDDVGRTDLSDRVLDELESQAVQTVTTASWPVDYGDQRYYWYYWYAMSNSEKNTAMALEALSVLRPTSPLAPKAARWLMENRWGQGWRTTQGTAFAVMGLTDYIVASGELDAAYTWTVALDGRQLATGTVNRDNVTQRIAPVVLSSDDLVAGKHVLTIAREGRGTLFYTVVGRMARYYDGFAPASADGLGIGLAREYAVVAGRGGKDGWAVGDVVNVRLTLKTSDELRYVIVEDLLPAGFEPLNEALDTETKRVPDEPKYPYYWRWWGYERKEMRDDKVTFFASYLSPGEHTFDYAARVVTPGVFAARPAEAYTMYRPEVWGRSASAQVEVAPDRLAPRPDLAGDFDKDCRLTEFDAALVADAWESGGKRDTNGNGRTDVADIETSAGRSGLACGDSVPLPPGPAGDMALALRAPDHVDQGQTFDLAVVATGAGNIGAWEVTLGVPDGAFEVIDLAAGPGLPDARLLGPIAKGTAIRVGGFAPAGATGSGERVLARLSLRAVRAGDLSIAVSGAQVVTDRGGEYRVTANGAVVSPAPWAPRGTVFLPVASQAANVR
jgi:alpha-2-macroglobulin